MGDAGLNPHDNYSGWSCLRYGVGETLFKYNDNMEVEPWLATDYEFTDDNTVKITLRDGVKFSSGRTMDGEAVKECLEVLWVPSPRRIRRRRCNPSSIRPSPPTRAEKSPNGVQLREKKS